MPFSWQVDTSEADALFGRILGISDLSVPMQGAAEVMSFSIANNFAAQGRQPAWDALQPITIALREGAGTGSQALHATGALYSAMTTFPGTVYVASGNDIDIYDTLVSYGAAHQEGPLTITVKNAKVMARRISEDQAEAMEANGLGEQVSPRLRKDGTRRDGP